MAKVKVKKQSTFIDMTAMSDVTVLLLTFFMLTSTFVKNEPVQVTTPASVSDFTIPETEVMTILVNEKGKIFLSLEESQANIVETLKRVGEDYGVTFSPQQYDVFKNLKSFGVPIGSMVQFLDLPKDARDSYLREGENTRVGIPDSDEALSDVRGVVSAGKNEFKHWVMHARAVNSDLRIAIKADKLTAYPIIKKIMDDLRELKENRYLLITTLKTASSE
ncbi:MAG: biopolymer transporter ExbD [Candidatus Symbiothrix sp.]|jgi:biopolymer transport protein ExbD|nr:biopolymer transporter ExbD [Candidatus Symbiothrix sp.]